MSRDSGQLSGFAAIIKRAVEGRVTPINFVLILGFFSSLVLLYVSLHIYFFSMSQDIKLYSEKLELLKDANVRLMAVYNDLSSPERIIPIVTGYGMRPGLPGEVRRLALYEGTGSHAQWDATLAQAGTSSVKSGVPNTADPESR